MKKLLYKSMRKPPISGYGDIVPYTLILVGGWGDKRDKCIFIDGGINGTNIFYL